MLQQEIKQDIQNDENTNAASENENENTAVNENADVTSGEKESVSAAGNAEEFERLIKGEYKDAFAKRVQKIINQRFKSESKKSAKSETDITDNKNGNENSSDGKDENENLSLKNAENTLKYPAELYEKEALMIKSGYSDFMLEEEMQNAEFSSLVNAGVDLETAYKTVHIEDIIQKSVETAQTKSAKQLSENLRFKSNRPTENGLVGTIGYTAKRGAAGLTPKERKDLAKKAMMGETVEL